MKRWLFGVKNKKALACIDWVKGSSARGCHYDTAVKIYGQDTVDYIVEKELVTPAEVSGGISIGDWDYKFKGLVLTEKGKSLALDESEREKESSGKARYTETLLTGFLYTVVGGVVVWLITLALSKQ